jgi:hypothetical protein
MRFMPVTTPRRRARFACMTESVDCLCWMTARRIHRARAARTTRMRVFEACEIVLSTQARIQVDVTRAAGAAEQTEFAHVPRRLEPRLPDLPPVLPRVAEPRPLDGAPVVVIPSTLGATIARAYVRRWR